MELDELVIKIINHIDKTKQETIREITATVDRRLNTQKDEIIREVNVLLEDQQKQFAAFGEGLQGLNDRMAKMEPKIDSLVEDMDTIKPMINNLNDRLTKTETILKQVK